MRSPEKWPILERKQIDTNEPRTIEEWKKLLNSLAGKNVVRSVSVSAEDLEKEISFDEFMERVNQSVIDLSPENIAAMEKAVQMIKKTQEDFQEGK